jgi:hypothetical protein
MIYALRQAIDWLAFRTTRKYNVLKIRDLPPNYWDKDTILLYAVMQLVVDFVEIECSFMEIDAPYTLRQRINFKLPWCLKSDEVYRNRELGLRHLKMLEETYQDMLVNPSEAPKAIREVYLWWKDVRPNRIDPDVASGLIDYANNNPNARNYTSPDKVADKLIKRTVKIEQQYEKEDTEMLNKVIKYRGFMWT